MSSTNSNTSDDVEKFSSKLERDIGKSNLDCK